MVMIVVLSLYAELLVSIKINPLSSSGRLINGNLLFNRRRLLIGSQGRLLKRSRGINILCKR